MTKRNPWSSDPEERAVPLDEPAQPRNAEKEEPKTRNPWSSDPKRRNIPLPEPDHRSGLSKRHSPDNPWVEREEREDEIGQGRNR